MTLFFDSYSTHPFFTFFQDICLLHSLNRYVLNINFTKLHHTRFHLQLSQCVIKNLCSYYEIKSYLTIQHEESAAYAGVCYKTTAQRTVLILF